MNPLFYTMRLKPERLEETSANLNAETKHPSLTVQPLELCVLMALQEEIERHFVIHPEYVTVLSEEACRGLLDTLSGFDRHGVICHTSVGTKATFSPKVILPESTAGNMKDVTLYYDQLTGKVLITATWTQASVSHPDWSTRESLNHRRDEERRRIEYEVSLVMMKMECLYFHLITKGQVPAMIDPEAFFVIHAAVLSGLEFQLPNQYETVKEFLVNIKTNKPEIVPRMIQDYIFGIGGTRPESPEDGQSSSSTSTLRGTKRPRGPREAE
jgi:hypothetical protein